MGDYLRLIDINANHQPSVIEEIAVAAKSTIDDGPNLYEGGALQNHATNKVFLRSIVCNTTVDEDRRVYIGQSVDVNSMKVVDTVRSSSIASDTVVRDIRFGVKVDYISLWINGGSADDSNVVRNICSSSAGNSKSDA